MSQSRELHPLINYGVVPLLQLVLAFAVAGLLIVLIGQNPVQAVQLYITDVLLSPVGIGQSIYYATTLMFTGMAVALAFHAGLFNIGGEGQGLVGGIAMTGIALLMMGHFTGDISLLLPGFLAVPILFLFAALGGAAWAAIPGYLQAYRGSHLVITTIMFNAIAFSLVLFLLTGWFQNPETPGDPKSPLFPESWWLWKLGDFYQYQLIGLEAQYQEFKDAGLKVKDIKAQHADFWNERAMARSMKNSAANVSFLFALLLAVGFWFFVWRTKWGYAIRAVGFNQTAARYGGVNVPRTMVMTVCISGALAGLATTNIILGNGSDSEHVLRETGLVGLGFVGIAVALMGRNHPFGIILAALLFGSLFQWGEVIQLKGQFIRPKLDIDKEIVVALQGLVVLFTGALYLMVVWAVQWFATRILGGWGFVKEEIGEERA